VISVACGKMGEELCVPHKGGHDRCPPSEQRTTSEEAPARGAAGRAGWLLEERIEK
jgi:hypothetical protein